MALASGGSPMFPLVVHQPASLASSAVTPAGSVHKSRCDNVVRMWVQLCFQYGVIINCLHNIDNLFSVNILLSISSSQLCKGGPILFSCFTLHHIFKQLF